MGFAADLKKLCDAAGDKAELVVRGAALELGGQMVDRSPVDTGRFKNAWVTSTGAADKSQPEGADKSGARALTALNEKVAGWKPGQTIWILNNLSYAKPLEYGHSQQAPSGIVRLTVQNYGEAISKAVALIK
ncbi:HK97 gp10 family phage protein [Delftia tsuruhatensis]|uniref:HK97 gp10 family phage protein n=1 Tax=Delftia tsuruhatensis TaxID=180282 RepID=UPI002260E5E1|nr:HK97 gp10 family phage protein [Delftia tsuruhatensis]MCX7509414.1 HK97 gp10 family phage protein [Delftia tsuruhatensis]